MAKEDLIGGSLWEQYSTKVNERMTKPRFMGEITGEVTSADILNQIFGDFCVGK